MALNISNILNLNFHLKRISKIALIFVFFFGVQLKPISAQPIVFKDEKVNYKKNFKLVDSKTKRSLSDYYAYIDDQNYNATGYFIFRMKYGYQDNCGLLDKNGDVILNSHPQVEIYFDTVARLIYRQFQDYKSHKSLIKVEVYDYQLNLLNTFNDARSDQYFKAPGLRLNRNNDCIVVKHNNGIGLFDKKMNLIKLFLNGNNKKYGDIKDIENGTAILSGTDDGYGFEYLIDLNGKILLEPKRSGIKRISNNQYRVYSYITKTTEIITIAGNNTNSIDCESLFIDFNKVSESSKLYTARNPKTSKYALIKRINECEEEIIINDLNNYTGKNGVGEFSISKKHNVLDSRGHIVSKFIYIQTKRGEIYIIDKYDKVISLSNKFKPIEMYYVNTSTFNTFDTLFHYDFNGEDYFFNPQNPRSDLQTFGPFKSISKYNSLRFESPKFIVTNNAKKPQLLHLNNKHWDLTNIFKKSVVIKNDLGKYGLISCSNNSSIIPYNYFEIDEYGNFYFCREKGLNSYTVYNSNGVLILKNIGLYTEFSTNSQSCPKQKNEVVIQTYDTDKWGILRNNKVLISPKFDYVAELPNDKFTCHINNGISKIINGDGSVFKQSNKYYLVFNCYKELYEMKTLKIDKGSGRGEVIKESKSLDEILIDY